MAKHKTGELTGALLDAAVAKAEGYGPPVLFKTDALGEGESAALWFPHPTLPSFPVSDWQPSATWAQAGPIIERELIDVSAGCNAGEGDLWDWWAFCPSMRTGDNGLVAQYGETPLTAAMRAYVASKFGGEVEL